MEFNVQVRNSQFEKSLLNKVARVANSLEREVENELKVSLKLTFSQLRVLNGLEVIGEASQAKLAAELDVTPAVITRQAEALRKMGLVEQRAKSKRENVLALTPKGQGALRDGLEITDSYRLKVFEAISQKDTTAFDNTIESLLKTVQ
ncbi:MAG TPA: MarR family winged helix-turn-helix transcriptional regulator [Candidatus Saccharimonadia bacterium]|jgi:DNA-binding MarR family transcriptional regulator